ncbi:MAG: DsrE family protein [Candidatus Acetothermia bacterium]
MGNKDDSLTVLWTSGDREIALNMMFMYLSNARPQGWWEEVTLIIWGPSAKLSAGDEEIQKGLTKLKELGVKLEACVVCAERYGVVDDLEELGIDVYGMGQPLTEAIKGEKSVITF